METIAAVMFLLGCSDDMSQCIPAEVHSPFYQSIAQCEADIAAQSHFADHYPLVVAKCLDVKDHPAHEPVAVQWHFNDNGVLFAYAGPVGQDLLTDPNSDLQLAKSAESN